MIDDDEDKDKEHLKQTSGVSQISTCVSVTSSQADAEPELLKPQQTNYQLELPELKATR